MPKMKYKLTSCQPPVLYNELDRCLNIGSEPEKAVVLKLNILAGHYLLMLAC